MYYIQNRFNNRKEETLKYLSLDDCARVGRTGFMGRGTVMLNHEKAIFEEMILQNKKQYISTSHIYEIRN